MGTDDPDRDRVFTSGPDGGTEVRETASDGPGLTDRTLRAMTFSTHVVSLNAMALMHLGHIEDAEVTPDREAARHVIDTLAMLKAKTQGNLSPDEARLLDAVLYDLQMKFVA